MNEKPELAEVLLPVTADAVAPDGSLVRLLVGGSRGGLAQFELAAGEVSVAQRHRTVEELWFIVEGQGRMWRKPMSGDARVDDLRPGMSVSIPTGAHFQFRNDGRSPLRVIGATMPPWPGPEEAVRVDGPWVPDLNDATAEAGS
jgi:mannose-6-phosphate isomerase-like protein (cupin superfamily)